jgi:hypothetical protein
MNLSYYDIEKQSLDNIGIYENYSKNNCYISLKSDHTKIYTGFIVNKKIRVMTICEVKFFRSGKSNKYVPRLIFEKCDSEYNIKSANKKKIIISFASSNDGYENFWKLIGFLNRFKSIVDLGEFDSSFEVMNKNTFYTIFKHKNKTEKLLEINKLMTDSNLTENDLKDIINDKRKSHLEVLRLLIHDTDFFEKYKIDNSVDITKLGAEAVFHHFLKSHDWMIGLNVDIKFIIDLISEGNLGISNTNGRGSPIVDFICISDYTFLVEIKTPNTLIFTKSKKNTARTNTWSFSDHFIDGISQCLGQKSIWVQSHKNKDLVTDNKIINQNIYRTADPKFIFIIGNKNKEFPKDNTSPDNITKRDTFELFRRNNRNIEIITYDELYERAYYIVYNKPVDDAKKIPVITDDDVPF